MSEMGGLGERPARGESAVAVNRPLTIWDALESVAAISPDKIAYVTTDDDDSTHRLTYGSVVSLAGRLSNAFYGLGVRRGDRVGIWMTNRIEWILSYFAAVRLGAVVVPLNTRLTAEEISHILRESAVRHLVMLDVFRNISFLGVLEALCPEVALGPPGRLNAPALPELRTVFVAHRSTGTSAGSVPYAYDLNALLGDAPLPDGVLEQKQLVSRARPADIAMLKYTSGSTAEPKGAMLQHECILENAYAHTSRLGINKRDRFFSAMPFFHIGGSVWGMMTMLAVGGTLVFTETFDAEKAAKLISSEQCTVMFGYLAEDVFNTALERGVTFPSLRMGMNEHPTVTPNLEFKFRAFGMTETCGPVTESNLRDPVEKRRATNGRPLAGYEVKAIDPETGSAVQAGTPGEALVRGPIMYGYLNSGDASSKARSGVDDDGWFHTGDIITIDDQGYVSFVGRSKLMLKVGGENVSVEEVERTISQHGSVASCVVVGVPDQRLQEQIYAYIALRPNNELTQESLEAWLAPKLARYKRPKHVSFMTTFPSLANGKPDRRLLHDWATEATLSRSVAGVNPHEDAWEGVSPANYQ